MNENFSFKLWEIEGRKRIFFPTLENRRKRNENIDFSKFRKSRVKREMKIYIFLNRERNFSFYFRLKKCFLVFKKPCFFAFYRKNSDCSTHVTIVGCICESNRWKIPEIKFARGVLLIFSKHRKAFFPKIKNVCTAFSYKKMFAHQLSSLCAR